MTEHEHKPEYPSGCSECEDLAKALVRSMPFSMRITQAREDTHTREIAKAHDYLGGMYSWNDAYLDDPANAHLWVTRAALVLRGLAGRPAEYPGDE